MTLEYVHIHHCRLRDIRITGIPDRSEWNRAHAVMEKFDHLTTPVTDLQGLHMYEDGGELFIVAGDHLLACLAAKSGIETTVTFELSFPSERAKKDNAATAEIIGAVDGIWTVCDLAITCLSGKFNETAGTQTDGTVREYNHEIFWCQTDPLVDCSTILRSSS